MINSRKYRGSCLCGAISFEVKGSLKSPTSCHCTKCRKHNGHFEAGTEILRDDIEIRGIEAITWYQSSKKARRGFCKICGSSLFFDPVFRNWIGVSMGAFDGPTNTRLEKHIFVANKGDYYELSDGLTQFME